MACGVHLGILLICLVQAEHVRCLWATQAQGQHSKSYVGFLQQDSGFVSSYPQNQLRQASVSRGSAQGSSLSAQTAVNSGSSRGLSSSGYTQTVSHPAKSGSSSVRFVQSNSVSKLNWRPSKVNVPKKQHFSLSTSIASGSSVSKYDKNNNSKGTGPIRQGTSSASKYQSSSSASLQSPSRESYSFKSASHQSTAQKAPAATPAYNGQKGYTPMKSSSLFDAGVLGPNRSPVRTKTSASAPARQVSSHRSSKASKPSRFSSLQKERARNNPSQMEAGKPYQSKLFPVTGGNVQGSYKPTSTSNFASNHRSYSQSRPVSNKHSSPAGFQPRSLKMSNKPSYTSTERSQSGAGPSGQRFAPTRTYNIPDRFGGFAIRRLRDSVDQKEVGVRKPQRPAAPQTYVAPQRPAAPQTYVAPQRPAAPQTYVAPQRPAAPQTYVAPQRPAAPQTYVAAQRPAAPQQPYKVHKPQTGKQIHAAPQQQSAHPKSQVVRVQPVSKWQRVRPNLKQPQVQ